MPHVSTHYRIYLGANHHRQPRHRRQWVEPHHPSEADVVVGGAFTPFAPPTLAYTAAGADSVEASFLFWSVSDGTSGRTQSAEALTATVGSRPLTLVAWYYLPSAGGDGDDTAVLVDAYSVAASNFVDDDFVTVTSDPSLTVQANVAGVVPTASRQTVAAFAGIPTGESFERWDVSPGGASASGNALSAPAKSGGLAIAAYRRGKIQVPEDVPRGGWIILFGGTDDSPGVVIPLGGGSPVPVDPWGPILARMLSAMNVHASSAQLSKQAATSIQATAAQEVAQIAKEIAEVAEKGLAGA